MHDRSRINLNIFIEREKGRNIDILPRAFDKTTRNSSSFSVPSPSPFLWNKKTTYIFWRMLFNAIILICLYFQKDEEDNRWGGLVEVEGEHSWNPVWNPEASFSKVNLIPTNSSLITNHRKAVWLSQYGPTLSSAASPCVGIKSWLPKPLVTSIDMLENAGDGSIPRVSRSKAKV